MTGQGTGVVLLGILFASLGFVAGGMGFSYGNIAWAVLGSACCLGALGWMVVSYRRLANAGRSAFEKAMREDFSASQHRWYHASGIAIDDGRGIVLLADADGTRRVPLDRVSQVEYHANRGSSISSGNTIGALIAMPWTISAMSYNATMAGLHITADGRSTRIIGIDPDEAAKWQSLLSPADGPSPWGKAPSSHPDERLDIGTNSAYLLRKSSVPPDSKG